jgi:hypothetical protein
MEIKKVSDLMTPRKLKCRRTHVLQKVAGYSRAAYLMQTGAAQR